MCPPKGKRAAFGGVFLPVYAARSGRSWGGGDFSDLEALITWVNDLGGGADYAEEARRYHLYVQWLAHEQLQSLAQRARQHGPGLYLDLPLGSTQMATMSGGSGSCSRSRRQADPLPISSSPKDRTGDFRPFARKRSASRATAM